MAKCGRSNTDGKTVSSSPPDRVGDTPTPVDSNTADGAAQTLRDFANRIEADRDGRRALRPTFTNSISSRILAAIDP